MKKEEEIINEININAARLQLYGISLTGAKAAARLNENKFLWAYAQQQEDQSFIFKTEILSRGQLAQISPVAAKVLEKKKEGCVWAQLYPKYCKIATAVGKKIPPVLDDTAQIIGINIKLAAANEVNKAARILRRRGACLFAEGVIVCGRDADQAFAAALIAEKAAMAFNLANHIGGAKPVSFPDACFMRWFYKAKYSKKSSVVKRNTKESFSREIPAGEMALRQEICNIGKQMLDENLVQGTWGNISMRLDDENMLCTPSGLDYFSITPYDIVKVSLKDFEYEGEIKPTSEKIFHGEILKNRPDINCVIHTHPFYASVFAAAHCPIEPKNEEEKTALKGDIPVAGYGLPGSEGLSKNVAACFENASGCIMENHGIAVGAQDAKQALSLCRNLEEIARKRLI